MRILRLIASMDPATGGPCEGIRNSVPAQKSKGVENEIVSFDAPDAAFLKNEKLQIHTLGPAKGVYSFCPNLEKWLVENLNRFDVAIIHGLWLYNSYGTFRIWKSLKNKNLKTPKLYVMPHGMLDPYFQKAPSRRLKALRNWIFWKLIENKVVNNSDGVLFTCEQELILAREAFSPYHPKVEINVGYGIQVPPQASYRYTIEFRKKCPRLTDRPYWLFLSRIHPKKGVDILIKAYLKLKKEVGNVPDLVIAGPGLDTSFGRTMTKIGRNDAIHFPGMLEGETKWGAFYNCEAFILPSHQENFGIAVVEAMACARPVLISNQVNIYREIQKANAGLVYDDTEEGVYFMLKYWVMESEDKRKEMGSNALKVFEQNYAIEKAAIRMIDCVQ